MDYNFRAAIHTVELITAADLLKQDKPDFIKDYGYRKGYGTVCRAVNLNKYANCPHGELITSHEAFTEFQRHLYEELGLEESNTYFSRIDVAFDLPCEFAEVSKLYDYLVALLVGERAGDKTQTNKNGRIVATTKKGGRLEVSGYDRRQSDSTYPYPARFEVRFLQRRFMEPMEVLIQLEELLRSAADNIELVTAHNIAALEALYEEELGKGRARYADTMALHPLNMSEFLGMHANYILNRDIAKAIYTNHCKGGFDNAWKKIRRTRRIATYSKAEIYICTGAMLKALQIYLG